VIRNIRGDATALLEALRKRRGTGGSIVADGAIELQGDHCAAVASLLLQFGLVVGLEKGAAPKKRTDTHTSFATTGASRRIGASPIAAVSAAPQLAQSLREPTVANAPVEHPDSFATYERLMRSWVYWDRDPTTLRERYDLWLTERTTGGQFSSGWLLHEEGANASGANAALPVYASLDLALAAAGVLAQPCSDRQNRARRRAAGAAAAAGAGAAPSKSTQGATAPRELAGCAGNSVAARMIAHALGRPLRPTGAAHSDASAADRWRAEPTRPTPARAPARRPVLHAAGARAARRPARARLGVTSDDDVDDDDDEDYNGWSEAPPSRVDLTSLLVPARAAAAAREPARGADGVVRALQGDADDDHALAEALAHSLAYAHGEDDRYGGYGGGGSDDDDELAIALALSLHDTNHWPDAADRSYWPDAVEATGFTAVEHGGAARLPHLLPGDLWGALSEDEAFQLAIALSQEAGAGAAAPPTVPPGLADLAPAMPHTLPPGLAPPPAAPLAVGSAGADGADFVRWANFALSSWTGHLENLDLVTYALAIDEPAAECEFLEEFLRAAANESGCRTEDASDRESISEWLARRLGGQP
jgi:hypothetical protein